MPQPGDYTVGWICAIRTEHVAARAFLDEEHEIPSTLSPNDNNAYTLGKMGAHNVVIAILPDGEYGISSATSVARDMMHSFCNIRVGLMVGIGGGAPSQRHDIRLGDVVVSAPRDGKGGVIQYDFGKTIQNQSFRPTGFLNQPPLVLRIAMSAIRQQYEYNGHSLQEDISNILQKKKKLQRKYSRPDSSSDRLYRPYFVHPNGYDNCWQACDDYSAMVLRDKRTEDEDDPAIHYGIIASGNSVMRDALIRDKFAAEEDILCFEMEAAGLMNHFPCLIIRGICDYSDSHKNKEWQGYAAMTAAAYAKDLLRQIAPNRVEAEGKLTRVLFGESQAVDYPWNKSLPSLRQGVGEVFQPQHDQLQHDQAACNIDILDWITPIEYGPQHSDFFNRREPGTGQWFLACDEYQIWLNSNEQTLFCPGIPGSGKSILTAIVVNDLITRFRNDPTIGIAYIYLNFRQKDDQNIENLMASLLKQLARSRSFPKSVIDLYNRHKDTQTKPSADEILEVLQSVAALYLKVFVVVDALDECQSFNDCRSRLLSCIFRLQANTAANLFVTSRPIPNIEVHFSTHLRREIFATTEDIHIYLKEHASDLPRCVLKKPDIQEKIKNEISSAVEGMFPLAQLYLNSLKDKTSIKQTKSALERFKRQKQLELGEDKKRNVLEEAYEQAMDRINSQMPGFRLLGRKVLAWIICAKRKLTASELQHALAVEIGSTEFDSDNLPEIDDMVSACAGLVTVDTESNIIRLAHYTAQEYLERTQQDWFPDAEADITEVCVTYLSFSVFESGPCPNNGEFQARLRSNLLYDYAAQNWGHHACTAPEKQLILDFLESKTKTSASGQAIIASRTSLDWKMYDQVDDGMSGVHLAAYFGLKCITSLLKNGHDANIKNIHGCTPLFCAAINGHEDIVRLLLKHGADIEAKNKFGETSLLRAIRKGLDAIVQPLLNKVADVKARDVNGQTLLSLAVEYKDEAIVRRLLEKGEGTKAKSRCG